MSEYGWKIEYILTLTMGEVSWMIDRIINRKNKDLEVQAALKGVKLKNSGTPKKHRGPKEVLQLDKKSEDAIKKAQEQARKRAIEWQAKTK